MPEVHVYSSGLCCCSVCVPKGTKRQEVEALVNASNPTGISSRWKISKDKKFKTGEANPHPCEKDPEREHYLMNC